MSSPLQAREEMKESQGDLLTGLTSICEAKGSLGENGGRSWRHRSIRSTYSSVWEKKTKIRLLMMHLLVSKPPFTDHLSELIYHQKLGCFSHSLTQYSSPKNVYLMGFLFFFFLLLLQLNSGELRGFSWYGCTLCSLYLSGFYSTRTQLPRASNMHEPYENLLGRSRLQIFHCALQSKKIRRLTFGISCHIYFFSVYQQTLIWCQYHCASPFLIGIHDQFFGNWMWTGLEALVEGNFNSEPHKLYWI